MIDRYKLAFSFDPARLQADLAPLAPEDWIPHFNKGFYDGDWSGVVLRGSAGRSGALTTGAPDADDYEDAPVLARSPALRETLAAFRCPLRSVRLLRLNVGSVVKEHRDYDLGYAEGLVRLHVPVITNPQVEFYLRNRRVTMREGEVWYLDLGQPHRVSNLGGSPRVHLVLDMTVNDWLRSQVPFEQADPASVPPRADEAERLDPAEAARNLESFRDLVRTSPELQAQLHGTSDRQFFVEETRRLGGERGYLFTDREVQAALARENRRWHEAWRK